MDHIAALAADIIEKTADGPEITLPAWSPAVGEALELATEADYARLLAILRRDAGKPVNIEP